MHEADGPKVLNLACVRRFKQKGNEGRVEQVPAIASEREKLIEGTDQIALDNAPAILLEISGKSIRSWSFPRWQIKNGCLDFLLGEVHLQSRKIVPWHIQEFPIDQTLPRGWGVDHASEVVKKHLLLVSLQGELGLTIVQNWDEIPSSSFVSLDVEELGIGLIGTQVEDARALADTHPLDGSQTEDLVPEVQPETHLRDGQIAAVLSRVEAQNDQINNRGQ